ncbi:MAG: phosphoribosylformylglycinamidine synthase, purS protein [Sulfobacillus benefaciens]|uniref:Phosphoribosylformylglycinamidine synthase subunit PurS n=1 Tax=Sulfobacillus benefaciens TaxID=453960 RepID=A0A2T2XFE9_9FIRM|nr:MAG: phosphoribosylformylglycinamidine synthase, purS protein [Sulfobacillus benefaciens]
MSQFRLTFLVGLKEGILDPAGQATRNVLQHMGYEAHDVRIGKWIQVIVSAETEDQALAIGQEMGKRILSNPVMEYFEVTVHAYEQ